MLTEPDEKLKEEVRIQYVDLMLQFGYSSAGLQQYTLEEMVKLYHTHKHGELREIDKHDPSQRKYRKDTI